MSAELWLSMKTAKALLDLPERTIRHKIKRGELVSRVRPDRSRSRNGRRISEIAASSLPGEIQLKLAHSRLAAPAALALLPPAESRDAQLSMFTLPPKISDEQRLQLTPAQNEVAQRRLEAISPLLEFRRRTNGHRPVVRIDTNKEICTLDALATWVASQHGVCRATIWNWYRSFQQKGPTALADKIRIDKGQSRFFVQNPAAGEVAQAKYLGEVLSVRMTHEALLRECAALGLAAPSYSTVHRYLDALPRPFSIMAREGEAEFHERCAPFLITDFRTVKVNQIWVSDHGKHDVWVRNDCFSGMQPGAALRPWLTAIEDMRSRKIVGAVWNATPSSHTISSSLRQAITAWGIPETFYIDNGKDYEAIGRIDFSPECRGVLLRLGIQPQYCIPKHPQSKLIESWFATVRKRFDCQWRPFYCGGSIDARPEECDLMLKEHIKAMKQGKPHLSPLPLASEFVAMARQWIEEYNATHVHGGRGMNGKTPGEVFEELLPPGQRRLPDDPHILDALFWSRERRRVMEGGCVQLYNQRYQPADEASSANLFMEIERDILVACDPCNLGDAIAMDLDGRVIGRLHAQKLIARGPVARDDVRAGMRKQRLVRRVVRDYIGSISEGHTTELDHLRKRAGIAQVMDLPQLIGGPEVMPARRAVGESKYIEDIVTDFLKGGE